MKKALCGLLLLLGGTLQAAEFKAGLGRMVITPKEPMWLCGYASRNHPSEGVIHDLWAKALAIEDDSGSRAVIVATDLIGLPRELSEQVAETIRKQYQLQRPQLLLTCSHTHCGPVVWPGIRVMFDFGPDDLRRAEQYNRFLADAIVRVVGMALDDLAPARLRVGHGSADFAINRREAAKTGVRIGVNPAGPVDHDVPVLAIESPEGKLRGVWFGYACHNTTLGGDFYQINGDYAGFAQIELEKAHPGTCALFTILCGADQNPHPRGKLELAEQHGKTLAQAVDRVLGGAMKPVRPPIRTAYQVVRLPFAPQDRAAFEKELQGQDVFRRRRARWILDALDAGRPIRDTPYPVQAIRLGEDLTLVALGGEVVVDYALRLKREFPQEDLVAIGYANDVMCYIPSLRVLREGGYEANTSMIYYGQPGPFAENVEQIVIDACRQILAQTGAKTAR